jgi:hypothetical protein
LESALFTVPLRSHLNGLSGRFLHSSMSSLLRGPETDSPWFCNRSWT